MMALWLRYWLAAEVVMLAAAAWGLVRGAGWHPGAAGAGAIGLFLAVNSVPLLASVAISRRHAIQATGAQPGLAALRGAAREWLVYLAVFVLIQPFERLWMGDDAVGRLAGADAPGRAPVLLIHGYLCNRGLWWWLRRRLRAAGFAVATIDLEPPLASIDVLAERLHERIEALLAETGANRLVLVGHSMGGLAARAYLARHGVRRVARLVTLASPHHGSFVACYGIGLNAREMEPNSDYIAKLPPADAGVPTVSIWSPADNFVAPQDSSRLAGAAEIVLPPLTHLAILFSARVLAVLRRELIVSNSPADPSR